MTTLTFEQWVAAVTAACHRTRAVLEMPQGMYNMGHAYHEAHLTVEEAVEYYTGQDTGKYDSLEVEIHGSIASKLDDEWPQIYREELCMSRERARQ